MTDNEKDTRPTPPSPAEGNADADRRKATEPSPTGAEAAEPQEPRPDTASAAAGPAGPPTGTGALKVDTTQPEPNEPVPSHMKSTPSTSRPAKGGRALATLALLIALAAALASAYVWYLLNEAREGRTLQTAELDRMQQALIESGQQRNEQLQDLEARLASQQDQIEDLTGQTANPTPIPQEQLQEQVQAQLQEQQDQLLAQLQEQQQAQLQEQQEQLLAQLEEQQQAQLQEQQNRLDQIASRLEDLQLTQRDLRSEVQEAKTAAARGDVNALMLSEVGYLLRLADHKLQFQQDVPSAIEVLEIANQRLDTVDEAEFDPVQRMIGEDLAALREVDMPDTAVLSEQISAIQQRIDDLPLRADLRGARPEPQGQPRETTAGEETGPEESGESWWDRVTNAAARQFSNVVTIRRERSDRPPLMAVEEEYFLTQNLRLELEAMRLALLRGDVTAFQQTNETAQDWLQTYFDDTDEQVSEVLDQLQQLQTVNLDPEIPNLSKALNAFQDAMDRRQPARPVVTPQEATGDAAQVPAEEVPAAEEPPVTEEPPATEQPPAEGTDQTGVEVEQTADQASTEEGQTVKDAYTAARTKQAGDTPADEVEAEENQR